MGATYSRDVVRAVCARLTGGESLAAICRDPAMPDMAAVQAWARRKAEFRQALWDARPKDGGPRSGARSTYCIETAQAIFERLCAGEGMVSICGDPLMPAYSTAWKWKRDIPEFAEAVALAREIQAEVLFEKGSEICDAVTPGTAIAARVRLTHLRWQAGKLAPRAFGPVKAMEPPQPAPELTLLIRSFKREVGPDGREQVVAYCPDPVTRQMIREAD